MAEKLTALNEIHNEENSELILENIVHTDNEWMADVVQDLLFEFQ